MSTTSVRFPIRLRCAAQAACAAAALLTTAGCNRSGLPDPAARASTVEAMRKADSAVGAVGGSGGASGWFTLKGRFTYNGAPPAMPAIAMGGKDPLCKVALTEETLAVDASTKGLANVLIYLNEAPAVFPDFEKAPPKEVLFDQKACRFLDHVSAVNTKDKWVVLNGDDTGHNAMGTPGRGNPPFNTLLSAKTGRFEYPGFKNPLTAPFEVNCSIHPWMKSYVIARPDPYFAVTAKDGTFTIEKVPAGVELEFVVWHERGAGEGHGLRAKPEWSSRGRFKLPAPKDGEVVTLDVAVEPSAFQ